MSSKIYAGTSAFFANLTGMHNWIDNVARPFLSVTRTKSSGKKVYSDLFINSKDVKVTVSKGVVTIKFPVDIKRPIFSIQDKA